MYRLKANRGVNAWNDQRRNKPRRCCAISNGYKLQYAAIRLPLDPHPLAILAALLSFQSSVATHIWADHLNPVILPTPVFLTRHNKPIVIQEGIERQKTSIIHGHVRLILEGSYTVKEWLKNVNQSVILTLLNFNSFVLSLTIIPLNNNRFVKQCQQQNLG